MEKTERKAVINRKKYSGVVVPMVTPLTGSKKIDVAAVERIIKSFSDNDLSPLILGTTGESCSFSTKESEEMVKATVASKGSSQHIYVGLVGNNVQELVISGQKYFDLGADVVVATLPSYYLLTPAQMMAYYETLADQLPGPLMMYNIKATTQMSMPLEVVEQLSHHYNIWGLKDSERDLERLQKSITAYRQRKDFSFFCGWGGQSAHSLHLGADGIVPSTGNFVPELYKQLYLAAIHQKPEEADLYQRETDEVARIYQEGRSLGESIAALKVMMSVGDKCEPYMKPPLTELSDEEAELIKRATTDFLKNAKQW